MIHRIRIDTIFLITVIDMDTVPVFFNRELSWIEFNARVLYEACRQDIPLIERLKFLSIVSSNFDEFFMVRVAGLKRKERTHPDSRDISGMTAREQLHRISLRAHEVIQKQHKVLAQEIIPALSAAGIEYIPPEQYTVQQKTFIKTMFENEVFPMLTPLRTDGENFPHISNLRLYIAFRLAPLPDIDIEQNVFSPRNTENPVAVVQIPAALPRIVLIPSPEGRKIFANFVLASAARNPVADAVDDTHKLENTHASKNPDRAGDPLLRSDHAVVPRFHGDAPCVVRLDGEDPVPACRTGAECRCGGGAGCPDAAFRPYLLLGDLPPRGDAGPRFVVLRAAAQTPQPLRLDEGPHVAAMDGPRAFRRRHGGRAREPRRPDRPLQRLRADRAEPAGAPLRLGQQPPGLGGRAG